MRKLALIAAVVGMSLLVCDSESWAKGGHGGSSGGHRGGARSGHGSSHAGGHRGGARSGPSRAGHQHRHGHRRVDPGWGRGNGHRPGYGRGSHHRHHYHHGSHGYGERRLREWFESGIVVPPSMRIGDEIIGDEIVGDETVQAGSVSAALFGMEIRELAAGAARKKGMKVGDIIMAVNGTATPDLESLQTALQESGSQAEVDFINVDSSEVERITLSPVNARIGATVQQVQVE
jgi:hypothetical protein